MTKKKLLDSPQAAGNQTPASTASVRGEAPSGFAGGGGRRKPPNIELTRTAEKQLRKLPKRDLGRVVQALEMLAMTPLPPGCRKLSGQTNTFRVRIGVYRIIYELLDKRLIVKALKIGHRKDVYR